MGVPARAGFTRRVVHGLHRRGDHPRSRGVYALLAIGAGAAFGSSPLARGLRPARHRRRSRIRIIPARAGFTMTPGGQRPMSRDHPRSRGVYRDQHESHACSCGSSPLARGLQGPARVARLLVRIIPARAGFTCPCPAPSTWVWDHPRSRGVYALVQVPTDKGVGSSPLARGLRRVLQGGCRQARIIPARAGFTALAALGCEASRDHPRSRGVYSARRSPGVCACGSSPLARGLHRFTRRGRIGIGIIPARAGFTALMSRCATARSDHPRSRGVYVVGAAARRAATGSSPLARGLRTGHALHALRIRIIPARAGFTCAPRWTPTTDPDHPRSRGVYVRAALDADD